MQKIISQILIFAILMQTNSIAFGQVRGDGTTNTTTTQAPNGTTVINIANPNGNGLSHNRYTDFNVPREGVIFNNSRELGASQLGGMIFGNNQLTNEARVILNEVTSHNRSQLNGFMEVFGRRADVIVANPNGITCNGCGFINTPRATLTTGRPINTNGKLGFDVSGGNVTITGLGLNAAQVDYFDIVSRAVQINGNIHGKNIRVVSGKNKLDYESKEITKKVDDGSVKPEFGIDSSALGGMYAGAITLVGTEDGVGVKAPENIVTSFADLDIKASGKIELQKVNTKGKLIVHSDNSNVEIKNSLHLEKGGEIKGKKIIQSENATILSSVSQDGSLNNSELKITADELELNDEVLSGGTLSLTADKITQGTNGDVKAAYLNLHSENDLDLTNGKYLAYKLLKASAENEIKNNGELTSAGHLVVRGKKLTNKNLLASRGSSVYELSEDLTNDEGVLYAGDNLIIKLDGSLLNDEGDIISQNHLLVEGLENERATQITNLGGYFETFTGDMTLRGDGISNFNKGFERTRHQGVRVNHSVNGSWVETAPNSRVYTREIARYDIRDYETITDYGQRGYMVSGNNITLDGGIILNKMSSILAQNDIAITGDTLNNVSVSLRNNRVRHLILGHASNPCNWYNHCSWREHPSTHGQTPFYSTSYLYSTIAAKGDLQGNLGLVNNSNGVRENVSDIDPSGKLGVAIRNETANVGVGSMVGQSRLFITSENPNSPYLYETRGIFADPSLFLGSDYFLSQVGDGIRSYNPDEQMRRLGDAYLETRVVREQITRATGETLLDGYGSDMEQMQALYDNASEEMQSLGLEFGIALTKDQIQNLTKDIIWLEKEVVNGVEVLVPKVYLSQLTKENIDPSGSRIQASKTMLDTVAIYNEGLIKGDDELKLNASQITNYGGVIGGGDIELSVDELLHKSAVNDFEAYDHEGKKYIEGKFLGRKALIRGDNVTITSRGNIISEGGDIKAKKNLSLQAEGTIHSEAIAESYKREEEFDTGYNKEQSLTYQSSSFEAGENLSLQAGKNINLVGVNLKAGKNIDLEAKEDINILSTQNQSFYEMHVEEKYKKGTVKNAVKLLQTGGISGLFDEDFKLTVTKSSKTTNRSKLEAGGDIKIKAGKDITLKGIRVETEGEFSAKAVEGAVKLLAAIDKVYEQTTTDSEGMWLATHTEKGHSSSTAQGVQIFAKKGVKLEGETIQIDVRNSIEDLSRQEGFEYLKELADNPDIEWHYIQDEFEKWDKSNTNLTQAGALLVTIAVSIATSGAGAGLMGAALSSLAGKAAVSIINNGGDLGAVFKELATSDTLRDVAIAMATRGFGKGASEGVAAGAGSATLGSVATKVARNYVIDVALETVVDGESLSRSLEENGKSALVSLAVQGASSQIDLKNIQSEKFKEFLEAGIDSVIQTGAESLVYGESFRDGLENNLRQTAVTTGGRLVANEIGDRYRKEKKENGLTGAEYIIHKAAHGALGCAMGEVSGGKCKAGAIGGIVGEIVGEALVDSLTKTGVSVDELEDIDGYVKRRKKQIKKLGGGAGVLAAAFLGEDVSTAQMTAENAVENNAAVGFSVGGKVMLLHGGSVTGTGVVTVNWNVFSENFLKLEEGFMITTTRTMGLGGAATAGVSGFISIGNDGVDDLGGASVGMSAGFMWKDASFSVSENGLGVNIGIRGVPLQANIGVDVNATEILYKETHFEGIDLFKWLRTDERDSK